jgi:UDP-N-acetylglucosamine--N-acetylmuramyl-(pentapeptide) pyrophosphoryl-undecaprenol N-acetylglucosamine transferase
LSLAHALKKKSPKARVIYIGLRGEKLIGLGKRLGIFDEHHEVSSGKLRRYHGQSRLRQILDLKTWFLNFIDIFKVMRGYFQARRLLKRIRPDLVLSKGGYVALPTGLAARKLRIPLVTHDSDARPGLTNRLLGRHAALHATAFPVENYLDYYPIESTVYTGLPLDERLQPVTASLQAEYKAKLRLPTDSFVLLVTGGGLGSKTLNEKTVALSAKFLESPKHFILHFSGSQHVSATEAAYERELPAEKLNRVKVLGFSPELYVYTGAADAVITRAGASSLGELALQHKACIIIPASFLSGGHQSRNIMGLKAKGAVLTADDTVTPQNLLRLIYRLEQNQHLSQQLGQNLGAIWRTDGAERLADVILGYSQ